MKILMVNSASYTNYDVTLYLNKLFGNSSVKELYYDFKGKDVYTNEDFRQMLEKDLSEGSFDCVMSTDFYPVIAQVCHEKNMKYISWPYDAPMNVLPCGQMGYATNYIFHFDKKEIEKYEKLGYDRFWHMPLGVNTEKFEKFKPDDRFRADISFMGKLYKSKLDIITRNLSDEMMMYIDKLVNTQRNIRDRWIVDELISQPVIDEMNRCYKAAGSDLQIIKEQLSYTISEYITWMDRTSLLEMLGRRFDVHLYTLDYGETEKQILKSVKRHGGVDYVNEMPVMFKSSKINLNSSLRSARSAIPLRALDVFGCGGFLLTNPQPEICEYFEVGKEVAVFGSIEEAIELSDYYLKHDSEREKVAQAGLERVKKDFRYEDKLKDMFKTAGFSC
ncbi:MAG: DUF3880 domain-containing protein [Butyrivibrio sp.]|nr:DUF3880 domain-containing protein [Butyrivibrio sp.]